MTVANLRSDPLRALGRGSTPETEANTADGNIVTDEMDVFRTQCAVEQATKMSLVGGPGHCLGDAGSVDPLEVAPVDERRQRRLVDHGRHREGKPVWGEVAVDHGDHAR